MNRILAFFLINWRSTSQRFSRVKRVFQVIFFSVLVLMDILSSNANHHLMTKYNLYWFFDVSNTHSILLRSLEVYINGRSLFGISRETGTSIGKFQASTIQNLKKSITLKMLLFHDALGPTIAIIFDTFTSDARFVAMVSSIQSFLFQVRSRNASSKKGQTLENLIECIIYCYSLL